LHFVSAKQPLQIFYIGILLNVISFRKDFPCISFYSYELFCTFTKKRFMKIFVAGLPYDLDDAELEEIFEKFGTIVSAKVAIDKETGKSKGFAFVEMKNREEGLEAIEGLNDISLGKKPLVVKEAEERSGPPRGGSSDNIRRNNSGGGGYNSGGYNNRNR
jgi:RNA recognition motif-containing protein